jgi:hypothetical protein
MFKLSRNTFVTVIVGGAFLISMLTLPAAAQDLEKKYAPIVGDYEFDMSEAGMGVMAVQIYVDSGALWAWPQDMGDPGEMIPKEGEEFVFTIEDDMSVWVLTFLKDESGKYTKCHAVNEMMGTDITGTKIIE